MNAKTTKQAPAVKTTGKTVSRTQKKIIDNQGIAQQQQGAILEALETRVRKLQEKQAIDPTVRIAVEWARIIPAVKDSSFVNSLALLNGALDIDGLVKVLPNAETRGTGYVQAKTVEKVVRMIHAFALRDLSKLDDYQQQVIFNALYNGDALSIRAAQASLSKRVMCEGLKETIKSRGSYTAGTATAQASQVREVLRVLGIAQVNKGKRDDVLTVNEQRASVLREVFSMGAEPVEA
jgi:polyhydroxyalkanoate synthesis regulator phasin